MKGWKEFDEQYLRPHIEKNGESAGSFERTVRVFSDMALRHVAYLAFQAGINSQKDE